MVMHGLRHKETGNLCGFDVSSNYGADFAVDVAFCLSKFSNENVWLVPSREMAEKAAVTNTNWYNAGYNTPENPYVGELEVVEVTLAF